jgi:predicted small lipoprotein YifL
MHRVILAAVAVALAGCGAQAPVPAPPAARAQAHAPLTTAQVARRADRIALVVARGSRVVEGPARTPFTRTRFAVRDLLKGELPRTFVIQVIGGRIGNRFVTSPVEPFARSHRYVLFLGPDNEAGSPTIYSQHVIELTRAGDAAAAERSIRRYLRTTGGSP